ncbi:MAG: amidophosphoribosyltransferase, partial [Clostridia bacterium]|nr:amidophosphoribosyltransferase [Clostridia bacterium]
MSNIHEECGVFGIFKPENTNVAVDAYYGLHALQHRGQESAGIVVNNDGLFFIKKDEGLVSTIFSPEVLKNLGEGTMAVGHVRYGTTGGNGALNAQPIVVNHIKGHMALAHNGDLVNSFELRQELELNGSIFHMTSDTEIIAYLIIKERLTSPSIEEAVNRAVRRLKGAYSLVIMSPTKLIAVRDENGFRPLCYGKTEDGGYVIASESCALTTVGAEFVRDIAPGEILIIDKNGIRSITDHCNIAPKKTCI